MTRDEVLEHYPMHYAGLAAAAAEGDGSRSD